MAKKILMLLVILAVIGVVFFFLNYEIQTQYVDGKAAYWKIVPKGGPGANGSSNDASAGPSSPTIRIASFQLGRLDDAKLANPRASETLIGLLQRFDLIALQGVRGKNQGVLIRLIERLNAAGGRAYAYATCPTQHRDALEHYSAFLYDRRRIDVDLTTVHFVEDPLGRIRTKPLVGLFQAHGPKPAEAFTFALVNVEADPDHAVVELDVMAEAYRAVRESLRGMNGVPEDDIILLGDLESDDQHLGQLGTLLGVTALLSRVPTTVRGADLLDNILLDRRATREFTGRVEVVDMMQQFGLTMPEAREVSEHLPIWAEFSVYEGGQAGHAAAER